MKLSTILDQIDMGSIALPEFQRGYVWNRNQVRNLMTSLYRGHPVGSLLVWETQTEQVTDHARGDGNLSAGTVKLLLDGQQRITSLYGMIRGKAPKFFDGNTQAFTGLYFNVKSEKFEFYRPTIMSSAMWVNVTDLMASEGLDNCLESLSAVDGLSPKLTTCIARLNKIITMKERVFHIEEVSGADKTVDEVVEIFNNVNSGGTKLSKGDLALARICAAWPDARDELKGRLSKWNQAGFYFKLDWFLRCITAVTTNESLFSALKDVSTERFRKGLNDTEKSIDTLLNVVSSRLGLDHDRVLGGVYAFPLMSRYLDQRGGHFPNHQERDQLLYWYVHTLLWGRYSGQTESTLRKDLSAIDGREGSLDRLIELLRQDRGDLRIFPNDFGGWNKGNRFYPMLYLLTRVCKARDWEDDIELSQHMLGKLSSLEVHHIFPKSKLYAHGYDRTEVNAIANFTFLTKETNLIVSNQDPEKYFTHYEEKHPGTIASHWIPMDKHLWKYENYREFLAARRELLAKAANDFLNSLYTGTIPESEAAPDVLGRERIVVADSAVADPEEQILQACNQWILEQQLPAGELAYHLTEFESGDGITVLDLAWPDGLQPGYSHPVALLLNEDSLVGGIASQAGFRFFTDIDRFKAYVRQEILACDEPLEDSTESATETTGTTNLSFPEDTTQRRPLAAV